MFYVQPKEFLNNKFNDQWAKFTGLEIRKANEKYKNRIKEIDLHFQEYFKNFTNFTNEIQNKRIQLATNIFIPEG
jgi:hypothetical protein